MEINFEGNKCLIDNRNYDKYLQSAFKSFDTLVSCSGEGNEFTGWIGLPDETPDSILDGCEEVRKDWEKKGVNLIVTIGIGGSYLGAKCAIEALKHQFCTDNTSPRIVFAGNNLSEDYLAELMDLVKVSNPACIVISKSGTTTEPAVAFRIVKQFLEEIYGEKEAATRIVAITDESKGALKTLSNSKGYRTFVIPDNVGGRYSVLTPVGLLPIVLAGFDIRKMMEGAKKAAHDLMRKEETNPAIQYAAFRNFLYSEEGKKMELLVSYNPKLVYFGEWWKQLFGESEGKNGKGLFPASVTFTTDLHSLGQYIQEGERLMFETVLEVSKATRNVVIKPEDTDLDNLNYLAGKHVEYCNKMAMEGSAVAHAQGGVPQIRIKFEKIDEWNLGYLFYFFEFACGISAYQLGVNPFNQPGVEAYKKEMFKLLKKPGAI